MVREVAQDRQWFMVGIVPVLGSLEPFLAKHAPQNADKHPRSPKSANQRPKLKWVQVDSTSLKYDTRAKS